MQAKNEVCEVQVKNLKSRMEASCFTLPILDEQCEMYPPAITKQIASP
jgi:hypothetical protein